MIAIQYHELTQAEYADAVVTSVIGGSTWMRIPTVYGSENALFVAAETPGEIVRSFASGTKSIRVEVR